MILVYSLLIQLYGLGINIAALFNSKAKSWLEGRRDPDKLFSSFPKDERKKIWVHCASLGEFEQGRPVIEELKNKFPEAYILLTFFSPSGYEIRKNYPLVDQVAYLPLDTASNAKKFVDSLRPDLSIFIKYEFWFNYLKNLAELGKPVIVVSAIFRPSQWFFKWYAFGFIKSFRSITHYFVQDTMSLDLLAAKGIHQATVTGDTRFDRVMALSKDSQNISLLDNLQNKKVLVAGSTWPKDEELIKACSGSLPENLLYIIVPHDISNQRIENCISLSPSPAYRYSQLGSELPKDARSIIIDKIGLLSSIYKYADVCFVGGGFGKGIHNTLEAAVYGKPVIFGPNFQKFNEAKGLIAAGAAFSVKTETEASKLINLLLSNDKKRETVSTSSLRFVQQNTGSTFMVMNAIVKYL